MNRSPRVARLACALGLSLFVSAPSWAGDDAVIHEVLAILKQRGDIDEAKYTELVGKQQAHTEKQASLLGRIEFSGDIRGRFENFFHDEDAFGNERDDRTRGRYRIRLAARATVNESVKVGFRLASGEDDIRSTNRSFGRDNDFGPDEIFLDRAYIELTPMAEHDLKLVIGKQSNPFRWRKGRDYMLFDSDINPEGVGVRWKGDLGGDLQVFANAGYFILDENSRASDPHLLGLQAGVVADVSETVQVGGRASWYGFRSINTAFLARGAAAGNVSLVEDASESLDAFELAGYVSCDCIEDWPALFYAHFAQNTDAFDGASGSEEDTGWGVGLEIGDKRKIIKLGVGYYSLEANYFPGQFFDSDLTDGRTNRKGWTAYASKEIARNTDLNVTLFVSEEIASDPVFAVSVANADRVRLQTDLVVKF